MATYNNNRQSRKNPAQKRLLNSTPKLGIYVGKVTSTKDLSRTGRMQVFIASLAKDPTGTEGYYDCVWTSPFAGSTSPLAIGNDVENFEQTIKSYGMWMVPPDIDNLVLVAFGDGKNKYPFVISCLYPDRLTHMVPGMPAGKSYSDPDMLMPVAEKNKRDEKATHNDATRPIHANIAESIIKQGLINDPLRGAGTSGSRRESPSEVFGVLTPGPRDPDNVDHRLGGHQFVMDDNLSSRLIRLRTAGGNQLLMDDTTGVVYVINKKGTAWFELGTNGDIHVYSEGSINMRAKGNFNLRADKNVNIEAGQDLHLKAAGDNIGDEYVGIPLLGALGLPPLGNGGNLRLEAGADLTQYAGLNAQLTANGGDIDLSAGSRIAATASGPLGFDFLAPTGPIKMQSTLPTSILSAAGFNVTSAAPTSVTAPLILLNSGGPPALPALPAVPAPQIGTQKKKDSPKNPPVFDREAAIKGEASALTAGQRTGRQDKIQTIVTSMPTAEPYVGHAQYDPVAATEGVPGFSQQNVDNLPRSAIDLSGKPGDVSTPEGFQAGKNFVDNLGNTVEGIGAIGGAIGSAGDLAGNLAGQAQNLLNGIPQFDNLSNIANNFKSAAQQKLLEITGLNNLVAGIKAAIPPIRFPTSNALAQKVIGVAKQLGELEAQLKQFAIDAAGLPMDLLDGAIGDMRGKISDALGSVKSFQELQDKLGELDISVIQDGASTIFQDKLGNKLVDISNGIGPIGETLGLAADLNQTYENVKGSIRVPLSENQTQAIASFANDIGEENFINSGVLQALNEGAYSEIPRLMQGWSLRSPRPGERAVFNDDMKARREWEAEMFQTPDEMEVGYTKTDIAGGSLSFREQAQQLAAEREDFIASKRAGSGDS